MNTIVLEKMKSDCWEKPKKDLADPGGKLHQGYRSILFESYPGGEIARTKNARREPLEFLEDYPFTSAGLGDHLKTLSTRGSHISLLEKQIRKYETLKSELQKGYRAHLGNELMSLVHELECLADAKGFLDSLTKEVKN